VSRFEELITAHILKFYRHPHLTSESGDGLQDLLNAVNDLVTSLTNIGVDISKSDVFIIFLTEIKLDSKSKAWWSIEPKSEVPTVKELTDFLTTRSKALLQSHPSASTSTPKQVSFAPTGSQKKAHHVSSSKCQQCSGSYPIWLCSDFKAMPAQGRLDLVKTNRLCANCLASHKGQCSSKYSCRSCGKPHNILLHIEHPTGRPKPKTTSHSRSAGGPSESVAFFGTLMVDVKDSNGIKQPCRVFVDDGSEVNFVSRSCLRRLGLKPKKTYVLLTVTGNTSGKPARGKINLTMESGSEPYSLNFETIVLDEFTGMVPSVNFVSQWPHFNGIAFSDPQYHTSQRCDIPLGGKKSGHILLPEVISDSVHPDAPVAWNTRFGWMVKGEAPPVTKRQGPYRPRSNHVRVSLNEPDVTRFWDQEANDTICTTRSDRDMSLDDMACEAHFASTHTRNLNGTYTVELPFKSDPSELG
jgi:hypothetical protein